MEALRFNGGGRRANVRNRDEPTKLLGDASNSAFLTRLFIYEVRIIVCVSHLIQLKASVWYNIIKDMLKRYFFLSIYILLKIIILSE